MINPVQAAIDQIDAERFEALRAVTKAIGLIKTIHDHHFSCRDALEKLRAAHVSISAINLGN